jgi:hypothetical protein
MPIYKYRVKKGVEGTSEGKIEALTEKEAIEKLNAMGCMPLRLEKEDVPTQFKGRDRRAYRRLDKEVNVTFKVFKSLDALLKRGFTPQQLSGTKNMSVGGLLFVSSELVTVGSILELTMELPDFNEPIECLVIVVRTEEIEGGRNYDVAGQFLHITSAHRSRLNKYIEREIR